MAAKMSFKFLKMYLELFVEKKQNKIFLFTNILMENSEEKILGGVIDNKLNFKSHINELCKSLLNKCSFTKIV